MSVIKKIDAGGLHLTVRQLRSEDLGQLIALTSSVSWQLTLEDLKMMHKADNEGFVGAFLDDGTLICHFSLIKFNENLAYLGLYITSLPYRGRGIGDQMLQCAIELAGKRTLTLDSVVGKPSLYERYGFKVIHADVIHVFGFVDQSILRQDPSAEISIKHVSSANVKAVLEFDEHLITTNRSSFLKEWLLSSSSISLCAVGKKDKIDGYIVIRPDHITTSPNSFKIGGFYAKDVTVACELLNSALRALPNKSRVWAEYPDKNKSSLSLYSQFGLNTVLEEYRLVKMVYAGQFPSLNWAEVYGITNSFNTFI